MKQLRVGMIGYKFMGKAHSNAYRSLPMFFPEALKPEMVAICGRNVSAVQAADHWAGVKALPIGRSLSIGKISI